MKLPVIKRVESLLNNHIELMEAPARPDKVTGLMVYKKDKAKYLLEGEELIGLNLAGLELTDAQWAAILKEIKPDKIQMLHLGKNQLKSLRISSDFSQLQQLEISDNPSLTKIILDEGLANLERIVIRDNGLKKLSLPTGMDALKYLDASRNQLNKIQFNGECPALECLLMSENELKNIYPKEDLPKLPALQYWYLDENPLNQSLLVHYDSGKTGNNYLDSFKALRKEFGDAEGVRNQEYKVLIVGDGTAGKTCIVNRMMKDQFIKEDSTHGIKVQKFTDQHRIYYFPHVLNLWDFGGQDIYHATHRLFLQQDAIYLLAWNKKTEEEEASEAKVGKRYKPYKNRKLEYWMRYIYAHGKGSPLLAVQTRKEDFPDYVHPQLGALIDKYKPLLQYLQFLEIDSLPDDPKENGFKNLMRGLDTAIDELGRDENLPQQWVATKDFLEEKMPKSQYKSKGQFLDAEDATMEYEVYFQKAKELGVDDPKKLLTKWLVPIGTVFYREGYFENKIILSQEWAIRAIYMLYERNEDFGGWYYEISRNEGKFTGEDLATYWSGYGEKERMLFIDFMLACGMCYEVSKEDRHQERKPFAERIFIAPEMLPGRRPRGFAIREAEWQGKNYLKLRYEYDFPYYHYFQQFLVRTQADAQEMIEAYRYGMHIYDSGQHAIIEFDKQNPGIQITVSENGKPLLDRIRNRFKDVHQEQFKTMVGVGASPMKDLSKLEHFKGQGLRTGDRLEAEGQLVDAGIYSPFVYVDERNTFEKPAEEEAAIAPKGPLVSPRIYFSYAWRDDKNPDREQLVAEIYEELKAAGFDVRRDKENCSYGEYIGDFMKEIGKGDLIMVFLSKKYFHSEYCMTELFNIADKNDWDKEAFRDRILPIQVEKIDAFHDLKSRIALNRYWKDKAQENQEYLEEFEADLGDEEKDKRGTIIEIPKKLSRLITRLEDFNRGSIELYRQDDFELIKQRIKERLSKTYGQDGATIDFQPFQAALERLGRKLGAGD